MGAGVSFGKAIGFTGVCWVGLLTTKSIGPVWDLLDEACFPCDWLDDEDGLTKRDMEDGKF